MYEGNFLTTDHEQEADLYDDLSQFIKIFKKIMNLSIEIMDLLEDESPMIQINQLKEIPEIHKVITEHYNYKLDEDSPHKK